MSRTRIPAIARLAHRRALLESLIESLKSRFNVSETEMQRALTKNEYGAYRAQLRPCQPSRHNLRGEEVNYVKLYLKLLRKADRLYQRAENANRTTPGFKGVRRKSIYVKSENAYADALETLEEMVSTHPGVATFFDRSVTFTLDRYPTLDPDSMPRLHTSRSQFAINKESDEQSWIYGSKLAALQASLAELYGGAVEPAVQRVVEEDEDLDIYPLPPDAKPSHPSMLDDDFL